MGEQYQIVPLSPLRKVVAARMADAKRTIPHFRVAVDVDMTALLAAREAANAAHPPAKITINDCIVKACGLALGEHPELNVQLHGTELRQYADADISVVVATAAGPSAPVVRRANCKSIREIALEMKDLAARAAMNRLSMDEILGGTFSVSNLGAYGVDQFDAIINAPQCAILAVAAVKPRAVVGPNRDISIASILTATLSVDHRALDGATAATFLSTLRSRLERPAALFDVAEETCSTA